LVEFGDVTKSCEILLVCYCFYNYKQQNAG